MVDEPDVNSAKEAMYTPIPVPGYRTLSQTEIDVITNIKRNEEWVRNFWREYNILVINRASSGTNQFDAMNNAKQHFKEAFMWMVRAIAKPENEW